MTRRAWFAPWLAGWILVGHACVVHWDIDPYRPPRLFTIADSCACDPPDPCCSSCFELGKPAEHPPSCSDVDDDAGR